MKNLRAQALERFKAMKWPTTTEEEWRRTDVSRLSLDSYAAPTQARGACPRDGDPGAMAGHIRFEGGKCVEVALSPALSAKGVRLVPLDMALEEFETHLHGLYSAGLETADNRFLAWHYATWSHGAMLWVPAGVEIAEPFFLDFQEQGSGSASAPHVAVILGQGARASVLQRIAGAAGDNVLCNAAVDMRLGDAAGLKFFEVQQLGASSLYFRHTRANVARDASLLHCDAEFGAKLAKTRVECSLTGRGAEAFLDGVYYCEKGQHMDMRTVQYHRSPQATSRAYYKGAVGSGGRTVYQGLIEVSEGASGTDAYLTNRNLILGEAARSDSIPTLRIGNNDVKCSHGSTTGKLSDEELFYLESRGLSEVDAREMLVIGYFEDLLTSAPETYREDTLASIRERLRGAA
ncbi:MAG TPA: Fe-S cluster assembly protein SufD [Spirochaetia bacterium]